MTTIFNLQKYSDAHVKRFCFVNLLFFCLMLSNGKTNVLNYNSFATYLYKQQSCQQILQVSPVKKGVCTSMDARIHLT